MLDNINLNSFLKFGYFLKYKNKKYSIKLPDIDKSRYNQLTKKELIEIGKTTFQKSIENRFVCGQKHLVAISGGLDSRAILAGLLECTEAKNIFTFTFGTPKTLDYEVGNLIAKRAGTNHTSFSLVDQTYTMDELTDVSKRVDHQTVLFHHPPMFTLDKAFEGCKYWSGFMGDPLAGSHLCGEPSTTLYEAKEKFIKKNIYVTSLNLASAADTNLIDLVDHENCIDNHLLTFDEQLDFANRQPKFIAPHVLMSGYDYNLPFLDGQWMAFMLSVDNKYRYNQCLYIAILLDAYPQLFSLATKRNLGLPLHAPGYRVFFRRLINKVKTSFNNVKYIFLDHRINYLDFNIAIRNKTDFKKIVYDNIMDLKQRNLVYWLDIDKIWKMHITNRTNYGDALMVLASLEIHLKSGLSY